MVPVYVHTDQNGRHPVNMDDGSVNVTANTSANTSVNTVTNTSANMVNTSVNTVNPSANTVNTVNTTTTSTTDYLTNTVITSSVYFMFLSSYGRLLLIYYNHIKTYVIGLV